MKKKNQLKFMLVLFFSLFFITISSYASVSFEFFQSSHWGQQDLDEAKIRNLLTTEFQLESEDSFVRSVAVKIVYNNGGTPDYMIVHLMDKETYSYETLRVNLEGDGYSVRSVKGDYQIAESDLSQDVVRTDRAACPDETVQMVFATCETGIKTAVQGVDDAAKTARAAGFKVQVLKGKKETVAAYENWLSCNNLMVFGRIGHGSPSGIMVSGGTLSYRYFQKLSKTALNNKVIYFNSCQVHNNPLKSSIVNAGVQKFIGGNVNLLIGPSEEVFKCFMRKSVAGKAAMTESVKTCERQNYPNKNAHGISGNGSDFINAGPGPNPGPVNPVKGLKGNGGDKVVNLSWNAVTGASFKEYKLFRRISSGKFNFTRPLKTTTRTSFSDQQVTNGTTYHYVAKAVYTGGESDPSNEVSATPNGSTPSVNIFDGFEEYGWSGGRGWKGAWIKKGDLKKVKKNPFEGKKYARFRKATGRMERVVDLSRVSKPQLKFAARVREFEAGDQFLVKVSSDGGKTYTTIKTLTNKESDNQYHEYNIDLTPHSPGNNFRIKFLGKMNQGKDYVYLDTITVVSGQ